MAREEAIGKAVLDAAMRVHTALGPGLLERTYELCLALELSSQGLELQQQVELPVWYRGRRINAAYRLDLLVEGRVVVELKAVDRLNGGHLTQLLSYLKLGNFRLGYLLNFNVAHLRDGIRRVVHEHKHEFP